MSLLHLVNYTENFKETKSKMLNYFIIFFFRKNIAFNFITAF